MKITIYKKKVRTKDIYKKEENNYKSNKIHK